MLNAPQPGIDKARIWTQVSCSRAPMFNPYCLWVAIWSMALVSPENHLRAKDLNPLPSLQHGKLAHTFSSRSAEAFQMFPPGWSPICHLVTSTELLLLALPLSTHPPWLLCLIEAGPLFLPLDYWVAVSYSIPSKVFLFAGERRVGLVSSRQVIKARHVVPFPQVKQEFRHLLDSDSLHEGNPLTLWAPFPTGVYTQIGGRWYGRRATSTTFEVWEICVTVEKLQTTLCLIFNVVK